MLKNIWALVNKLYLCSVMKIKIVIKIDADTIRKMDKTAHRNALVEAGLYNRPTHQVHKSVKDYVRKPKHKKVFLAD